MEASVNRFQLCLTLQFETNTALDKFRAETRRPKPIDLWSTFLLQSSSSCGGRSPVMIHETATRPPGTDRAPYFAALVESS